MHGGREGGGILISGGKWKKKEKCFVTLANIAQQKIRHIEVGTFKEGKRT